MSMGGKGIALRLFEEAFNRGNLDVIGELVHPDLVYHYTDSDVHGLEGARQLVIGLRSAFPDFHVTAEDVLADGDKVVARFTDSGTYQEDEFGAAAVGRWLTWTGVDIFRITDGKIIEGWGSETCWAQSPTPFGTAASSARPTRSSAEIRDVGPAPACSARASALGQGGGPAPHALIGARNNQTASVFTRSDQRPRACHTHVARYVRQ